MIYLAVVEEDFLSPGLEAWMMILWMATQFFKCSSETAQKIILTLAKVKIIKEVLGLILNIPEPTFDNLIFLNLILNALFF